MNVMVNKTKVMVSESYTLNDKEYNVNQCEFFFSEEYTDNLVKKAVFVQNDFLIEINIINNKCNIPIEVLNEGIFELHVYAYEVDDNELILRYSPSFTIINVKRGSYVENTTNTEPITPTDKQQIEQSINDLANNKQDNLVSGTNVKTINGESILGEGNLEIPNNSNYRILRNKPKINNVELDGNKSLEDLEINIPTIPENISAFNNDVGYLTQHQDISGKLDISKVKNINSTTAGDVYDVRYINSLIGNINTVLATLTTVSGGGE